MISGLHNVTCGAAPVGRTLISEFFQKFGNDITFQEGELKGFLLLLTQYVYIKIMIVINLIISFSKVPGLQVQRYKDFKLKKTTTTT